MSIMPNVGWSNAVPDAVSEVHLEVNGTKVDFSGVGYHDSTFPNLFEMILDTDETQRTGAMRPSQTQSGAGSGATANLAPIRSSGMTASRQQAPSM
jgi:hypothetical protein